MKECFLVRWLDAVFQGKCYASDKSTTFVTMFYQGLLINVSP